jgi:hypothetical protein
MISESKQAKSKSRQARRVRFRFTGDYFGGLLQGFGLGVLLIAALMIGNLDIPSWETIFNVGVVILVIGILLLAYVQGRRVEDRDKHED